MLDHCQKNQFSFPGYERYHFTRHGKLGGGVSIFLKDKYACDYFDIVVDNDRKVESVLVKMKSRFKNDKNKPIITADIYKPPGYEHFDSEVKYIYLYGRIDK